MYLRLRCFLQRGLVEIISRVVDRLRLLVRLRCDVVRRVASSMGRIHYRIQHTRLQAQQTRHRTGRDTPAERVRCLSAHCTALHGDEEEGERCLRKWCRKAARACSRGEE